MAYRKDHKGRVLRSGESQRKDGRYVFKYLDLNGKENFIYSWKLEAHDSSPKGKRDCIALREKEKEIQKNLFDQIAPNGGDLTVLQLVKKYLLQKTGVKPNTQANYKTIVNFLSKDHFGNIRIDKIKQSDAKIWLITLQKNGKSYSSIHSIRGVLRPAFQMAVDDDLIRKNPFEFQLASVIVNDKVTRNAITRKQERDILKFIKEDKHFSKYYEGIYILFKTGLRISEFVGLTISDLDFKNRIINIDHQLQRLSSMEYVIETTKTNAGTRKIPMTNDVYDCFKKIVSNRPTPKIEPIVYSKDKGYSGFLYLDKNGMPLVALHWENYLKHICNKYNKIYKIQMPKITPHVCRHTYCSIMAKSGMNPKTLQYLMGHSDIGVTLNTYTHLGFEDAKEELQKLAKAE